MQSICASKRSQCPFTADTSSPTEPKVDTLYVLCATRLTPRAFNTECIGTDGLLHSSPNHHIAVVPTPVLTCLQVDRVRDIRAHLPALPSRDRSDSGSSILVGYSCSYALVKGDQLGVGSRISKVEVVSTWCTISTARGSHLKQNVQRHVHDALQTALYA